MRQVKKSQAIRRKSEFSSCVEVSQSVVRLSRPVDFVSCSVDLLSHPVDFVSLFAPVLETRAIDITHLERSRYGKRNSNLRSKSGILSRQKPKKDPKNEFWSLRNCDLRRFGTAIYRVVVMKPRNRPPCLATCERRLLNTGRSSSAWRVMR